MARALIFSTEANPAPFLETRFLPVIQALEVFCNASGSEKYVPATEFKQIKKSLIRTIPANLPLKLKEKLRTSIGFANELSLNDRILHLLNALEPATRQFVCQDEERFARRLKDTRNYYTHYGDSRGKHLTGKPLHMATEQASLLLKLVMLKECGVRESLLQQRLSVSHYRSQGMQIWAGIEKELLQSKGTP